MKTLKEIGLTTIFFIFCTISFAQKMTGKPTLGKQEYLEKSRNQKQTAWILLGGGALAVAAGTAIFVENFDIWSDNNGTVLAGSALAAGGGVAMVGSIFMFSAAKNNHERAMEMGFKMEKNNWMSLSGNRFTNPAYPSMVVRLPLK